MELVGMGSIKFAAMEIIQRAIECGFITKLELGKGTCCIRKWTVPCYLPIKRI